MVRLTLFTIPAAVLGFIAGHFWASANSVEAIAPKSIDVSIAETWQDKPKHRLLGKLHEPMGTVVTVQGYVVDGAGKGREYDEPRFRVQRINGRPTQEFIQIKLRHYFRKFGEKFSREDHFGPELPELINGNAYEFECYETGEYVGRPSEAYRRAGVVIQTSGFYFSHDLVAFDGKRIDPIAWSPADFVDRSALIEGTSINVDGVACIDAQAGGAKVWRLRIDGARPWPQEDLGKLVEGFGVVRATSSDKVWRLEKGTSRLVRLHDQIGRRVELRGMARSLNGVWWFDYRGEKIRFEEVDGLPAWEKIAVSGMLRWTSERLELEKPQWKPIDALLSPEEPNY